MTRILIVDDEKLARQRLRLLLDELDIPTKVIGEAPDGKKAIELVRNKEPDLLLLDIQMPVLDGFDVVDMLPEPRPPVIFITAFDEYALKAFEVHAVDYLLKPVRTERLRKSLRRLGDPSYLEEQKASVEQLLQKHQKRTDILSEKLAVEYRQEILMVDLDQVLYLEADGKLTWVHTEERRYHTNFRLHELEKRLKAHSFFRIHRSYIVNLKQIEKLEPWFNRGLRIKLQDGTHLDVARRRLSGLKERLGVK